MTWKDKFEEVSAKISKILKSYIELFHKDFIIESVDKDVYDAIIFFGNDFNVQVNECTPAISNRAARWATVRAMKAIKKAGISVFATVEKMEDHILLRINSTVPFAKLPENIRAFIGFGSHKIIEKHIKWETKKKVRVRSS